MGFWDFLRSGGGTLTPEHHAQLEADGLLVLEEGLSGSVRYTHFKAPGKRFNGKVTPEMIGLGISEKRMLIFCRNGRGKLTNSEWTKPMLKACEAVLKDEETVDWRVDYDRIDEAPKVSGQITIRMSTPNAPGSSRRSIGSCASTGTNRRARIFAVVHCRRAWPR